MPNVFCTPSKVASYRSMIIDGNNQLWVSTVERAVYSLQSNPKPLMTGMPVLTEINIDNKSHAIDQQLGFQKPRKPGCISIRLPTPEMILNINTRCMIRTFLKMKLSKFHGQ